jgi:hypothetical protein
MPASPDTVLAVTIARAADDVELAADRLRLATVRLEGLIDLAQLLAGDLPAGQESMPEDRLTADAGAEEQ